MVGTEVKTERRCRKCGCTDALPCEVLGMPCCWVQSDLCSACATVGELLASEDAGLPWLIDVTAEHCARTLLAQMRGYLRHGAVPCR